jgi:hypothetical protein
VAAIDVLAVVIGLIIRNWIFKLYLRRNMCAACINCIHFFPLLSLPQPATDFTDDKSSSGTIPHDIWDLTQLRSFHLNDGEGPLDFFDQDLKMNAPDFHSNLKYLKLEGNYEILRFDE